MPPSAAGVKFYVFTFCFKRPATAVAQMIAAHAGLEFGPREAFGPFRIVQQILEGGRDEGAVARPRALAEVRRAGLQYLRDVGAGGGG